MMSKRYFAGALFVFLFAAFFKWFGGEADTWVIIGVLMLIAGGVQEILEELKK